MPTVHPRYTVTDTGPVREMLDLAARRWPELSDRRQLLLRLAAEGSRSVAAEVEGIEAAERREFQEEALSRARDLIDVDVLLSDAAWR
jgi:hypothetical protein